MTADILTHIRAVFLSVFIAHDLISMVHNTWHVHVYYLLAAVHKSNYEVLLWQFLY